MQTRRTRKLPSRCLYAAFVCALSAVFTAGGCSSSDPSSGGVVLRDGSHVVSRTASDAAIVEEARLRFPLAGNDDLLARVAGDILIGARSASAASALSAEDAGNPRGFLRRVVAVHAEGATIIVDTEHATLDEAFSAFDVEGHITPVSASPLTGKSLASLGPPQLQIKDGGGGSPNGHFELRYDREWDLASGSTAGLEGGAQWNLTGAAKLGAHLLGSLDFDPAFDIGFHAWAMRALLVGSVHSSVSATVDVEGSAQGTFSYDLPFAYNEPVTFLLLDIPVEATLSITASVECEVEAEAKIDSTVGVDLAVANVQTGIICGNGAPCESIFKHDPPTISPIGPTLDSSAKLTAKCSLKPDFALYLYDLIGPYGEIAPYVKSTISGPPCNVSSSWGLDAIIGLRGVVPFVHQPWFDAHKTFNLVDQPLYSGGLGDCGGSSEGLVGAGGESSSAVTPLTDSTPVQPAHVTADASGIYWTDVGTAPHYLDGRLLRRSSTGSGDAEVVLSNRKYPSSIVADATSLYWVEWGDADSPWDAGAVYSLPKTALADTPPKQLHAHLTRPFALAVDADSVYVSEANAEPLGLIEKFPLVGGARTVLARGLDQPLGLALDATRVYFTVLGNEGTGYVGAVSKAGAPSSIPAGSGSLVHLVDGLQSPIAIAVDASGIYATTVADASGGSLLQIDPSGASNKVLGTGLAQPYTIALESRYVLIGNGEEIIAIAKAGGRPIPVLQGIQPPVSLIALPSISGGSLLIWTELGNPSYRLAHGGLFATYFNEAP